METARIERNGRLPYHYDTFFTSLDHFTICIHSSFRTKDSAISFGHTPTYVECNVWRSPELGFLPFLPPPLYYY